MERDGIKVDRDELRRLSGDFEQRMAVLEKQIYKLAGREFNIGSPKQLGEVLFDKMGLARRPQEQDRRLVRPTPPCWRSWRRRATSCRHACSTGASSRS